MLEMMRLDFSRNLRVVVDKTAINGSKVGSILVSGEVESDLEDEFVDLSVELNPEERHWPDCIYSRTINA
jgi:hypothetical protein